VWGNRGGGKSVALRWMCHALALAVPGFRYAILRTSYPELFLNHLQYLDDEMDLFGPEKESYYHKTEHCCYYPNGSRGFFFQCENDGDVKHAIGAEVVLVVFDEAPTFKWEHMRLIAASVRVKKNSGFKPMVRYLGNPFGQSIDELWQYFIDKDVDEELDDEYDPADWRAIEIHHQDNPHLDVEAYHKQFVGLSPAMKAAWKDGVRMESRTLFTFRPTTFVERVDETTGQMVEVKVPYHVITELPTVKDAEGKDTLIIEAPWVKIFGGYDDGYVDPAVMLWFVSFGDHVIAFNERKWIGFNSPSIAQEILTSNVIVGSDGKPYRLPLSTIYADPVIAKETTSVQSTQDVMQHAWHCFEHGVTNVKRCCDKARALTFEPSTNSRELYASAIHRLLDTEVRPNVPKLQIFVPDPNTSYGQSMIARGLVGCPLLKKYLPKMQWDENDPKKMADHRQDHYAVALAYYGLSRQVKPTQSVVNSDRPKWWDEYFVAGSNVPKAAYRKRRR
jgi:hypothetical protein